MARTTRWYCATLVVVLGGCAPLIGCTVGGVGGGGGDPGGPDATVIDCELSGSPSVTLGGGTEQTGFVDMADGGVMSIVLGPQGLYMVMPSIRTVGMYPGTAGRVGHTDDPMVLIEIVSNNVVVGGSAQENLGLTQTVAGAERLGIFTPFAENASAYVGTTVTLRASVSDACGNSSSDTLSIVVQQ